jgi:hypothetical protein
MTNVQWFIVSLASLALVAGIGAVAIWIGAL